jgi:hypothetical protein
VVALLELFAGLFKNFYGVVALVREVLLAALGDVQLGGRELLGVLRLEVEVEEEQEDAENC